MMILSPRGISVWLDITAWRVIFGIARVAGAGRPLCPMKEREESTQG